MVRERGVGQPDWAVECCVNGRTFNRNNGTPYESIKGIKKLGYIPIREGSIAEKKISALELHKLTWVL